MPEVLDITFEGLRILVDGENFFLSYADFPWFRNADPADVRRVMRPQPHHLRWPDLDIDLDLDSLRHPDRYPLRAR